MCIEEEDSFRVGPQLMDREGFTRYLAEKNPRVVIHIVPNAVPNVSGGAQ